MTDIPENMQDFFKENPEETEPCKPTPRIVNLQDYKRPKGMSKRYWKKFIVPRLGKQYGDFIFGDEYLIQPE